VTTRYPATNETEIDHNCFQSIKVNLWELRKNSGFQTHGDGFYVYILIRII